MPHPAKSKTRRPYLLDRYAVRESVHPRQRNALAALQAHGHGVCSAGLHANDLRPGHIYRAIYVVGLETGRPEKELALWQALSHGVCAAGFHTNVLQGRFIQFMA